MFAESDDSNVSMSGGPDCSDHPDPESDNNAIASDEVKKNIYTYLCYMYTGSICKEIVYATVMVFLPVNLYYPVQFVNFMCSLS